MMLVETMNEMSRVRSEQEVPEWHMYLRTIRVGEQRSREPCLRVGGRGDGVERAIASPVYTQAAARRRRRTASAPSRRRGTLSASRCWGESRLATPGRRAIGAASMRDHESPAGRATPQEGAPPMVWGFQPCLGSTRKLGGLLSEPCPPYL